MSLDLSWLSSDGVAGLAVVSWVSGAWLVSGAVSPALRSLVAGAGGSVSGERDEALVAGGDELCPGPSLGETQDASTPGGDQARGHGQQPQVGHPGVLESTDAVFGASTQSVAHLQIGDAAPDGIGGEHGDAPAVVVGDVQLGARMGTFAAGDDAHPGRP